MSFVKVATEYLDMLRYARCIKNTVCESLFINTDDGHKTYIHKMTPYIPTQLPLHLPYYAIVYQPYPLIYWDKNDTMDRPMTMFARSSFKDYKFASIDMKWL